VPKQRRGALGDAWIHPEHVVVNGPYILRKWWSLSDPPRTQSGLLRSGECRVRAALFLSHQRRQHSARNVESGERGWATLFPSNQAPTLRQELPSYVHVAPFPDVAILFVNVTRPRSTTRACAGPGDGARPEFLATQIYKTNERPAYALVPRDR